MSDIPIDDLQRLFDGALQQPPDGRSAWLDSRCGDDAETRHRLEQLLAHAEPSHDPLEVGIEAVCDLHLDEEEAASTADGFSPCDWEIDLDQFLDRVSAADLLSGDELKQLCDTATLDGSDTDPQTVVANLIASGTLTRYQASALIRGEPDLLIDKYLILDLIDAGGMGVVFKAIHRPMNRTVAIKMISPRLLCSAEQVRRFQREVRVAASLEQDNIVRAYDADQCKGTHFLVMEYVRGDNLARMVGRDGPLTVERAVDCIRQAAKGLHYANTRGVIHRDIKPGNLMLTEDGLVKVLDLGLASIDGSLRINRASTVADDASTSLADVTRSELTRAGTVLGTVSYMAPEQSLDAEQADVRCDIYSLGCTLYFLLAGKPPFRGDTADDVFAQHRNAAIPPIGNSRPDVPESIEFLASRMLAKNPDDRYQTMDEVIAAIDDCESDLSGTVSTAAIHKRRLDRQASTTDALPLSDAASTRNRQSWKSAAIACSAIAAALLLLPLAFKIGRVDDIRPSLQPTEERPSRSFAGRHPHPAKARPSLPTVAERFASGEWTWSKPYNPGAPINSPKQDLSPTLNGDQSIIVFWSNRAKPREQGALVWTAHRPSFSVDWSEPVPLRGVRNAGNPQLSSDGLSLLSHQGRRGSNLDLFVAERESLDQPFGQLESLGSDINSSSRSEAAASLSGDGLVLIHTSQPIKGREFWAADNGMRVFMRTRESIDRPFGEPERLVFVDPSGRPVRFGQMFLTPNALDLYGVISYADARKPDLGVSSRPTRHDAFGAVIPLPSVNTVSKERTPWVSEDGTTLWFTSDRPGGLGSFDIWVSKLIRN